MADITAAAADDAEIGDLEAELKMKREVRDDKYIALNDKRSKVGLGVAGSAAYGNDSPLYGAGGLRPQIRPCLRPHPKNKTADRDLSYRGCWRMRDGSTGAWGETVSATITG